MTSDPRSRESCASHGPSRKPNSNTGSLVCLMDCRLALLEPRLEIIKKFAGLSPVQQAAFSSPSLANSFKFRI
jgi:hypothetical protein